MSTTELQRTAFDDVQREAGTNWTDWEGWAWAADFGDASAGYGSPERGLKGPNSAGRQIT